MRRYKLIVSVFSSKGNTRKINQDNFFVNGRRLEDPLGGDVKFTEVCKGGLFAVADGMGGEHEGEFASRKAVDTFGQLRTSHPTINELSECISMANDEICNEAERTGSRIGSTIAAAVIDGAKLDVCNIGDSRVLIYSSGRLDQITKDHTVAAQMIEAGLMTEEQASHDKRKHQLFQHLGISSEEMSLSLFSRENIMLSEGDIVILCSDGLSDGIGFDDILDRIMSMPDTIDLASDLARLAMKNGSTDNVTVITIAVKEKRIFGLF